MNSQSIFLLLICSALGGAINAIAGGGTLLTFPVLVAILRGQGNTLSDALVLANGTSTMGLFVGPLAAAYGYRQDIAAIKGHLKILAVPSIVGGALGAYLLTDGSPELFSKLVPWLILFASVIFLIQPKIALLKKSDSNHEYSPQKVGSISPIVLWQFLIAIYGGYFGAGIGILMLALLSVLELQNIHMMNALKSILGFLINAVAVGIFIVNGKIEWQFALLMMIASSLGAFYMARTAVKIPSSTVRKIVACIGVGLSFYYFIGLY